MKFRYKVLFTNLILLSLGLGLVGYLMIHKNFELAKQTQLKNAIVQNNLVQSSVEYELLQLLNSVSEILKLRTIIQITIMQITAMQKRAAFPHTQ